MATHDYVIANQNGANFRSDLNNVLQAIISNNSSATEPSTTSAYMWWADTANDKLKMRNGADSAWIDVMQISTGNPLFTGDLNLGDGDKINFGDSNDLQIYHDGSMSYIDDAGNGDLRIRASNDINFRNYSNDATVMNLSLNNGSEYVQLYYAGSQKLATTTTGIDVTGDVIADNVGIGTSSPSTTLEIQAPSTVGGIKLRGRSSANDEMKMSFSNATGGTELANIYCDSTNFLSVGTISSLPFTFKTANTERMRIDGSGNVLIGTTSQYDVGEVCINYPATKRGLALQVNSTGNSNQISFRNPNGLIGHISTSGTTTTYNTSSDYRLKENVVPMSASIDRLKQLNPVNFNFIVDADTTVDGFLAHEVFDVVPEATTGEKDAMKDEEYEVSPALGEIYTPAIEEITDEEGNVTQEAVAETIISSDVEQPETLEDGQQWRETTPAEMGTRTVPDYQGIDQSKLVPLLTGALQEAIAKIESLEARIEALEA